MSGGIEAQIEDSAVLAAAAQMLEGKVRVTTTENFYPVVVGLGVKKGNTALADAIRAALAEMNTSGFYPALLARYGVSQPSEEEFKAAIGE
jgi:polar amino acid transport system substrate-binding protein